MDALQAKRKRLAAASRRWYANLDAERKAEHLAQARERHRKWREKPENREKLKANHKRYRETEYGRKAHYERVNLNRLKYRASNRQPVVRDYVRWLWQQPCHYCGGPGGCIDHVVPLSKGGTNDTSNLVPCCRPCNSRKGNRLLPNTA
jgi:5-methylcytosine-specific restriction endonuclease McrA